MRILRHILTGKDNETYDIVRVGMLVAFLIICVESLYGIWLVRSIDLEKLGELIKCFSVSVANILGWGSVGCAAKAGTEP